MQIKIGERTLGIETAKEADIVYVSHAHSDHLIRTKKHVLASKETIGLMRLGLKRDITPCTETLEGVELHNAGHILGSTQLRFTNGHTTVHTGDMKLRDGFTTRGAKPLECDTLYIDATFGDPAFSFPSKEIITELICQWTAEKTKQGMVIFGAYKTGKAQELIALLNEGTGIEPVVDDSIEERCKVYEKHGVKLERIPMSRDDSYEAALSNGVVILPFHKINAIMAREASELYGVNVDCALVTGWSMKYRYPVPAFPLSDHGGFDEIVEYVETAKPKKIVCKYGDASRLIDELRRRGFNAKSDAKPESILSFLRV
jgi:putative mRNA 3-end processing factor